MRGGERRYPGEGSEGLKVTPIRSTRHFTSFSNHLSTHFPTLLGDFIHQANRSPRQGDFFLPNFFPLLQLFFFPVGSDRPDRPLVQQLSPFFSWPARVLNVLRSKISQSIYETFQRSAFGPICEKPPNIWKGNSAKESSAALSGNKRRVADEARR